MAVAALLLADLLVRIPDLQTFYTDDGLLPRALLLTIQHRTFCCLHMAAGTLWGVGLLHGLSLLAALALLLGYRTRLATLLCWLLHLSLRSRNAWTLDAGDAELTLVLFWGLFLPWNARASVDAVRSPSWAQLPQLWRGAGGSAYAWQIGLIYLMAGWMKSDPLWLVSGDALFYVLHLDSMATPLAIWLRTFPEQLRPLTFAAVAWELTLPWLLWCPWKSERMRWLGLGMLFAFHLTVGCLLQVGLMVPVGIGCALGLLPTWDWKLNPTWKWNLRLSAGLLKLCAWLPPSPPQPLPVAYKPGGALRGFLGLCCAYVLAANLAVKFDSTLPMPVQWFGYLTQLFQSWPMFAPAPGDDGGWFVVEGTDWKHRRVDLLLGGEASNFKPADVSRSYINQRWRCFLLNLRAKNEPAVQERLLEWSAARWNRQHTGDDQVYVTRLLFFSERCVPPGKPFTFFAETMAQRQVQGPGVSP